MNVIGWAIDHWSTFAQRARAAGGLPGHPSTPHIGFLLAHHGVAINMMVKSVPEQAAKIMAAAPKEAERWEADAASEGANSVSGSGN